MENFNDEFYSNWGNIDASAWLTDVNNDPFMPSTWNDENGCSPSKRLRTSTEGSHNSFNESSQFPSLMPHLSQQTSEFSDVFDVEVKRLMNNILSDINAYGLFNQTQLLECTNLTPSETYTESHIPPSDDTLISNEENVLNFIESLPSTTLSPIPSTSNGIFESQEKVDSSIPPFSISPSHLSEGTSTHDNSNLLVEILPTKEETPDVQTDESTTLVVNYDTQKPTVVQATFDLPEELQFLEHCSNSSSPPLPSPREVAQNNPPISESFNINYDDKGKTQYHCKSCSGVLRTYKEATKHFRNKHALYQCTQCHASNFVGYFRMNAHSKKMHKKPSTVHCQCGRGFSSEKGLNKHKLNCPAYQEHMVRLRATLKPTYQFLN